MNRKFAPFFILTASIVMWLAACAKKEAPDTPYTRIQGKWKLVKTATDDNNNRIIEETEKHAVPAAQDYQITFNKDYTGIENSTYNGVASPPLYFNWDITGADSIRCSFTGHDTLTYYLVTVSSGSLTLQTNTRFGLAWYNYNKK